MATRALLASVAILAALTARADPPILALAGVNRPAPDAALAPADGLSSRWGDDYLAEYGYQMVDRQLAASRAAGKAFELRVIFGWRTRGAGQMPHVPDAEKSVKQSEMVLVPLIWTDQYQAQIRASTAEMAQRYRGQVDYVCVTGIGRSDELYTPDVVQLDPGYSEDRWLAAARGVCRAYRDAFGANQKFTVGISSVFTGDRLVLTTRLLPIIREELPNARLAVHSLQGDSNMSWLLWRLCRSQGPYCAEMVIPSSNRRFGGTLASALRRVPDAEFVRVYPPDLMR